MLLVFNTIGCQTQFTKYQEEYFWAGMPTAKLGGTRVIENSDLAPCPPYCILTCIRSGAKREGRAAQAPSFYLLAGKIWLVAKINWREGERARIVNRPVTEQDRKSSRYFEHMAGLEGVIQNVYNDDEIAVKVDLDKLGKVTGAVHKEATSRMRERFSTAISEEQKKQLTAEELNFEPHYVLLVRGEDLERP